jgi:protein TonB
VTGRALRRWIYFGSASFHVALAVGAYSLPSEQRTESVAIELADIKKKNDKPKPPPPPPPPPPKEKPKPPPPPPPPQAQAKVAPESVKPEAPAPEPLGADGFMDLGSVPLAGGLGGAGGAGDGVGIAAAAKPNTGAEARSSKATTRKVEQLAPATSQGCTEADVSPRHISQVLPKMTHEAQQAEIEGVVLIDVTIDPSGSVVDARIVRGLGYGLDEAALRAAKAWTFQPAMRCGRPIVGHKKIPFRFTLT